MSINVVAGVAAVAVAAHASIGVAAIPHAVAPKSAPTTETLLQLVNRYRAQHEQHDARTTLSIDSKLQAAALANTTYMVRTQKMRTDPAVQQHFGTACALAGGLVDEGPPSAKALMTYLEKNASTAKVLLGPYTLTGIAATTSRGLTWVTLDFVGFCSAAPAQTTPSTTTTTVQPPSPK